MEEWSFYCLGLLGFIPKKLAQAVHLVWLEPKEAASVSTELESRRRFSSLVPEHIKPGALLRCALRLPELAQVLANRPLLLLFGAAFAARNSSFFSRIAFPILLLLSLAVLLC